MSMIALGGAWVTVCVFLIQLQVRNARRTVY